MHICYCFKRTQYHSHIDYKLFLHLISLSHLVVYILFYHLVFHFSLFGYLLCWMHLDPLELGGMCCLSACLSVYLSVSLSLSLCLWNSSLCYIDYVHCTFCYTVGLEASMIIVIVSMMGKFYSSHCKWLTLIHLSFSLWSKKCIYLFVLF